jgi:predicted acylesterase/phospholipase RssA
VERKIREFLLNKDFDELEIPFSAVAYNLNLKESVTFSKGDVARAVRASMSIPGIFEPIKIDGHHFIDGVVSNPTPFDVVREMGADVVIAVDLYPKEKKGKAPIVRRGSLVSELKKKLFFDEMLNVKNYIFPEKWPQFIRKLLCWIFDKIFYPARVLKILSGRAVPPITKVLLETVSELSNNLAKERLKNSQVDVKVVPHFGGLTWLNFDKVEAMVKVGERAMDMEMSELKRKLRV